jgi:hypothetical protein
VPQPLGRSRVVLRICELALRGELLAKSILTNTLHSLLVPFAIDLFGLRVIVRGLLTARCVRLYLVGYCQLDGSTGRAPVAGHGSG